MEITTVSLKHHIYRAHDVLEKSVNDLIRDEFIYNRWIFDKVEPTNMRTPPFRGWLETKNKHNNGSGDIIGYNNQFIKIGIDIKYQLQRLVIDKPLELYRINTNIQYFGMESSFHFDSSREGSWSFVYFIGPSWDTSWGGEFCVRTGQTDYTYVPYIPNTGVLFPASLLHMGSAPNLLGNLPRCSIAFVYHERTTGQT